MLDRSLKRNILLYAKRKAPYDTGNLRFNAIKGKYWSNPNKFTVHYSGTDASYIQYLEENQKISNSNKENKHYKFVTITWLDLRDMIESHFNNGKNFRKQSGFTKEQRDFTFERSLRHIRSLTRNLDIDEKRAIREVN